MLLTSTAANAAKRRLREARNLIEDVRRSLQDIGDQVTGDRLRAISERIAHERDIIRHEPEQKRQAFLNLHQFAALEKVIERARAEPGVHRQPTLDGEASAFQFDDGIEWSVKRGNEKIARGTCSKLSIKPTKPPR